MLPSRDEILEQLYQLREHGERRSDEASRFIGGECRVALYALVQAHSALARSEILGGLYYLRAAFTTCV